MKVILTKDVERLGSKGDIVDVADGYGRNYLVPKAMAVRATDGALRQATSMRRAREESERKARQEAEQLARELVGARIVVAARAGDEGKLFGSVGPGDVGAAIKKFTGHDVDRKIIVVEKPIREIGLHEVAVEPHPDVHFKVILDVIPA